MKALLEALLDLPEATDLVRRIGNNACPAIAWGLSPVHKAHLIAALRERTGRPVVILSPDETAARGMLQDLAVFCKEEGTLLSGRDLTFYDVAGESRQWEYSRLSALYQLATSRSAITAVTAEGILLRTLPRDLLLASAFELSVGCSFALSDLAARLTGMGYVRAGTVEGEGQFAIRGGIVDIFAPGSSFPVRAEFFGDEADSLGYFNTENQRRIENIESVTILPASELLPGLCPGGYDGLKSGIAKLIKAAKSRKTPFDALIGTLEADLDKLDAKIAFPAMDRYIGLLYPMFSSALDYLPSDAILFIDDPSHITERIKNIFWRHNEDMEKLLETGILSSRQTEYYLTPETLWQACSSYCPVMLDTLSGSGYPLHARASYSILAKRLPSYAGSLDSAISDFGYYISAGFRVLLLTTGTQRARRIYETLLEKQLPAALDPMLENAPEPGCITVSCGAISAGMEYPGIKLAVITEEQLFPAPKRLRAQTPKKEKSARARIRSFTDLNPGDLVVHDAYGIGCFSGIEKLYLDGTIKDFIKISYAGGDNLYLPATQLDQISKYIGAAEDSQVRLNKLGGGEWHRTRARAKSAAKDLAKQLIALYAERQRHPGFAFPADTEWQKEFEEAFEFEETDDQLRTVTEIKADMERSVPMERLLCGDVGFGKTEVAFRAIMKCILGGKQAAILVPTTVLARQHHLTALHRFRGYPVKIAVLSRFVPPSEIRDNLRRIQTGAVDLVIGTHKLLQKDLIFKDLGLLVVDEEQRFGVTHKERLKEITKSVDVLTLSATPIPRTLNLALAGIRDMSVLEEAPAGRYPVKTYVLEHSWDIITDAINKEVSRGGQVYYLHNRVDTISRTAAHLRTLLPNVSIVVGHGQMDEETLGDVMRQISEGQAQVLVCTTIIEAGVDIPNVNTIIIEDADKLGLSQLHQIRGRVGRSTRHAYAYLTYRPGRVLSDVATKRLSAIREFAEFGAGFKIAMRDLEIRGAGNILGSEQSGHMVSVGYDMYLKLLEEAVLEERGEKPVNRAECTADFAVNAYIPEEYVFTSGERMDIYRRIAFIRDSEDASDITDELCDRYGDCPPEVLSLIKISLLRSAASAAGVSEISQKGGSINFTFSKPDFRVISELCALPRFKGRLLLNAGDHPYIAFRLKSGEDPLAMAEGFITALLPAKV